MSKSVGAATILVGQYNPALVGLSILVAIQASATLPDVAGRIRGAEGGLRVAWILAASGTGLGMHIVYNLVTQTLKGAVAVETPARGASFTIRFPMHVAATAEAIETV